MPSTALATPIDGAARIPIELMVSRHGDECSALDVGRTELGERE